MNSNRVLVTPFFRQCFVTLGVATNVMSFGLISGYAAVLLPQLTNTKYIELDDESLSWIASIIGFSVIVGAFIAPSIMSKKGRRLALITGCLANITGWVLFIVARNTLTILFARFFQGMCLGIGGVVAHVTIGEYTSPKNRGAFLVLHPFSMFLGSMIQHVQGVFLTWKTVAAVSLCINIIAMIIVILSPETPSFLATRGKFKSCKKSFHWLRGHDEEDELEEMIKAVMLIKTKPNKERPSVAIFIKDKMKSIIEAFKKKEFYKPVILAMHLQFLNLWSGSLLNETYMHEIYMEIFGNFNDMYYVYWSLDAQRILTAVLAMVVIRKVKRRKVLLIAVLLNITAYVLIAGYVYGKKVGMLPNSIPVGVILLHFHYFTIASGCTMMPNIIAGEIYPLEYRSICGMISTLSFSIYIIIKLKTLPFLFAKIGLHGAYLVYASLVGYSLIVLMSILPETKDKTLQTIENEFKGSQIDHESAKRMIEIKN
ncbi:hypothetical protein K1T71_006989 [Dendrolimus kikuchii]|uniref:Uncharacterized protein n=1 Tax=Dendrolimus kikuchii TaxID=765133 RepID=A0ACC1CZI2_9NEOP|nr:hypothetical protein K1T71_006989 [Dendrolimus kikuchii]